MTKATRIQVLFEHGYLWRPYGSAYLRLLRPLSHPALQGKIELFPATNLIPEQTDGVIVDRLWRPEISLAMAKELVQAIRATGARFIYSLDDQFFAISKEHVDQDIQAKLEIVDYFLRQADAVLVTTDTLKTDLGPYNEKILVLPHALDERLLVPRVLKDARPQDAARCKVIGCMGTLTHDEDLLWVLPALQEIYQKHAGQVRFEFVGVMGKAETRQVFKDLPVRFIGPEGDEREYPLFMLWFTSRVNWDIALSPLVDTQFNRAKSDVKFLDYASLAVPGVYSPIPAYQRSIEHRKTGWLAENTSTAWFDALDALLQDDALRAEMGNNAYRYLYAQRTLVHCAPRWAEAIETIFS